ncbi:MAG: hypothetical protein WCF22_06090, partial [Candidatus Sulfotelmatobacter sp.]
MAEPLLAKEEELADGTPNNSAGLCHVFLNCIGGLRLDFPTIGSIVVRSIQLGFILPRAGCV